MRYGYKWTPSKAQKRAFAQEMEKIRDFCSENGISHSYNMDSYYFELNGKSYRVSNHTIERSNARAFDEFGNQIRDKYHTDTRDDDVIYIHAGKTRIIEIYEDLLSGYELDGKGFRK